MVSWKLPNTCCILVGYSSHLTWKIPKLVLAKSFCKKGFVSVWDSFKFKACVRYFLSNLYFPLNDSPSKTMKIFFISRYIHIFAFPSSPLFLPVSHCFRGWSKINLKVYLKVNNTFCLISWERKKVWYWNFAYW